MLIVVVASGATVRLTGSGLGCPSTGRAASRASRCPRGIPLPADRVLEPHRRRDHDPARRSRRGSRRCWTPRCRRGRAGSRSRPSSARSRRRRSARHRPLRPQPLARAHALPALDGACSMLGVLVALEAWDVRGERAAARGSGGSRLLVGVSCARARRDRHVRDGRRAAFREASTTSRSAARLVPAGDVAARPGDGGVRDLVRAAASSGSRAGAAATSGAALAVLARARRADARSARSSTGSSCRGGSCSCTSRSRWPSGRRPPRSWRCSGGPRPRPEVGWLDEGSGNELRVDALPELRRPVLVASFRGWNDGGHGASLAGVVPRARPGAPSGSPRSTPSASSTSARRGRRSRSSRATMRRIDWPENAFHHARLEDAPQDAVLLLGSEPSLRWRTFCSLVTGLAQRPRRRARRHARLAARRRAAHAARAGHRERQRPRASSSGSACSRRATRARPGSSACSTTPAARPASRRCRSGRRCRTTSR